MGASMPDRLYPSKKLLLRKHKKLFSQQKNYITAAPQSHTAPSQVVRFDILEGTDCLLLKN